MVAPACGGVDSKHPTARPSISALFQIPMVRPRMRGRGFPKQFTDVWIRGTLLSPECRPRMRGRGLKRWVYDAAPVSIQTVSQFAPHAGAWIETSRVGRLGAPFPIGSPPHAGAWIETRGFPRWSFGRCQCEVRPPCGGVDRNDVVAGWMLVQSRARVRPRMRGRGSKLRTVLCLRWLTGRCFNRPRMRGRGSKHHIYD